MDIFLSFQKITKHMSGSIKSIDDKLTYKHPSRDFSGNFFRKFKTAHLFQVINEYIRTLGY